MSRASKSFATLALIAGVILLAVWLSGLGKQSPPARVEAVPPDAVDPAPAKTNKSPFFSKRPPARADETNAATATEVSTTDAGVITNWEEKVDEIIRDDNLAVGDKAKKMLELFPQFPAAGQSETAQHIANLLADADYEPFGRYLTNATTSAEVQDVILADLLGRPNTIKLPWLLAVARTPNHAKAAEARELLQLYLEEDFADRWDEWQKKMDAWLKENPD
jgi:hypothetical protein